MGRRRNPSRWGCVKRWSIGVTSRHYWYALILICVWAILQPALLSHARDVHTRHMNHTKSYEQSCDNVSTVNIPIDVRSDITGEWKSLGGDLHIPWNRIEVIDIDQYSMEHKKQAVLREWYEDREEVYWEEIVEALKRMDQRRLSNRINACKGKRLGGDKHTSDDPIGQKSVSHVHPTTFKCGCGNSDHSTSQKTTSNVHTTTHKNGLGNGNDTSQRNSASHLHTTTLNDGLDNDDNSTSYVTAHTPGMLSNVKDKLHCKNYSTSQDTASHVHTTTFKSGPGSGNHSTGFQIQESKILRLVLDRQVSNDQFRRNCTSLHLHVMPMRPQNQQNDLLDEVDVCSFALFFLRILLLLGGDIERNPGPETKLKLDDHLSVLINELECIQAHWQTLGIQLKVPYGKLETFHKCESPLTQVLVHWLQGSNPPATWANLIVALRSNSLRRNDLASKLESTYCTTTAQEFAEPCSNAEYAVSGKVIEAETRSRETRQIIEDFGVLFMKVLQQLEKNKVQAKHFVLFLEQQAHAFSNGSHSLFLSELRDLYKMTDLTDVFCCVKNYCSWYNHHLLKNIIEAYSLDGQAYKKYCTDFQGYCRLRICRLNLRKNGFGSGNGNGNREPVMIKIDKNWSTVRLEELEDLTWICADILEIQRPTLHLRSIEDGCVELHYLVPTFVTDAVFPLTLLQEAALVKAEVLRLHTKYYLFSSDEYLELREVKVSLSQNKTVELFSCDGKWKVWAASMLWIHYFYHPLTQLLKDNDDECEGMDDQEEEAANSDSAIYYFDDETLQAAFEDAMKMGYVDCRMVLLLLIGAAGSGKSHVKNLLFQLHPPLIRRSTPLAEAPIRSITVSQAISSATTMEWRRVTLGEIKSMMADAISGGVPLAIDCPLSPPFLDAESVHTYDTMMPQSATPHSRGESTILPPYESAEDHFSAIDQVSDTPIKPATLHSVSMQDNSFDMSQPAYETETSAEIPQVNLDNHCSGLPLKPVVKATAETLQKSFVVQKPMDIAHLAKDFLDLIGHSSGSKRFLDVDWVYVIDSGGQPQFNEILPIFIRNTSAVIFTLKINEKLGDYPMIEYYDKKGQKLGSSYTSSLTHKQILQHSSQVIQSRRYMSSKVKSPKLFIVGTHNDLKDTCPESVNDKNQWLKDALSFPHDNLASYNSNTLLYPVNAKTPSADDKEVANDLRREIMKAAKDELKVPLPWFVYEQFVQQVAQDSGVGLLSTKQCKEIAQQLHMSEDSFNAALKYFSDLKLLLYYPQLLPNVVFCNSQVVLDKISELVAFRYRLDGVEDVSDEGLQLRDYGIFKIEFLEHFDKHYVEGLFTPHDLLQLLNGLLITFPINSQEYVMPCLLSELPPEKLDDHRQLDATSPATPLLLRYRDQCLPAGIFVLSVAFLQKSLHWNLCLDVHSGKPLCLYRNCVKFHIPATVEGNVTIIDSFNYLEVHVHAPPGVCQRICCKILASVMAGLEAAADTLGYENLVPQTVFHCPNRGPPCSSISHFVLVTGDKWNCTIDPEVCGDLIERQKVWFHQPQTHTLFSKDTVYHAGICSLAVNDVKECDPGNYQKFFQKNPLIPGHDFQEVSISKSKKDRYLIARQGESTVYIAFQSEPCIQQWPKLFRSFSEGIKLQTERFPIHFLFELLRDGCRIVLTGFSFGGLLACAVAAQVWNSPHTTSRELRENLACITFGQPYLHVPLLLEIAEQRPDIVSTIHTIYWQDDIMPRLMRFLNECCSSLKESRSSAAGAQLKMQEPPRVPFQDPMTSVLFEHLGKLQKAHLLPSGGSSLNIAPDGALKPLLEEVASSLEAPKQLQMCTTSYLISRDGSSGLVWDEMSKEQGLLRSNLSSQEADGLVTNPFVEHSMAVYSQKVSWSYLEKPPSYATPPPPKSLGRLCILEPSVSTAELHHHGDELAITLEGNNLWFCYRTTVGGHPQDIPAHKVYTGNSIQFNIPTKDSSGITVENEKVKVTLHSHFQGKSKPDEILVRQKDYSVTSRQRQLAKLTPSKLIELAYLSALLEQYQQPGKKSLVSHKVDVVRRFLENVVRVVPLESIAYTIAYGEDEVALQCTKALLSFYSQQKLPLSVLIKDGVVCACRRMSSGISTDIYIQVMEKVGFTEFMRTFNDELPGLLSKTNFISEDVSTATKHLLEKAKLGDKHKVNPDGMPRKEVLGLGKLSRKLLDESEEAKKQGNVINAVCGLNIEEVYPITHKHVQAQMHMNESDQLQCPLDILRSGKMKLSSLAKKAQSIQAGAQSVPPATLSRQKRLDNSAMLKTVNDIRQKDLAICTALLGGFMEQQVIDIPLVRSCRDRSEAFSLHGAASVGVWALSSLNYDEIQPIFARCQGNQLLVKIEEYVKAIFSAKSMEADDDRYAAKLQFIVQGMQKTVSCNSQYISYSLERQLFELCDDKIDLSMPLDKLVAQWGTLFKKNILSLVALSHRPLIARWLKWALMVHNLREELAKYTAVGVAGLVNSGKSKLVNSLFGINIPFGTKETKRTTIPFMYNLEKTIQGLDVVDFPGVDDMDETIPDLAELLLTLAQIVIFVVDYRKVHTESARKWLEKLQESSAPTLVCLTFADKLYAEHMTNKGDHPPKDYIMDELKAELSMIKEKLGVSPSRTVKFFSFSQDNDSVLNKDEGRQRLRDVGIGTPPEVGEWLVDVFKNRFGQDDLADRLHSFVQKTSAC